MNQLGFLSKDYIKTYLRFRKKGHIDNWMKTPGFSMKYNFKTHVFNFKALSFLKF